MKFLSIRHYFQALKLLKHSTIIIRLDTLSFNTSSNYCVNLLGSFILSSLAFHKPVVALVKEDLVDTAKKLICNKFTIHLAEYPRLRESRLRSNDKNYPVSQALDCISIKFYLQAYVQNSIQITSLLINCTTQLGFSQTLKMDVICKLFIKERPILLILVIILSASPLFISGPWEIPGQNYTSPFINNYGNHVQMIKTFHYLGVVRNRPLKWLL